MSENDLHRAVKQNNNIEQVKKLLNENNTEYCNAYDDQTTGYTPFYDGCQAGRTEIVKLMIAHDKIDANKKNNWNQSPLHTACRFGYTEIIILLLSSKRYIAINDKTSRGITALDRAAYWGKVPCVKLLLSDARGKQNMLFSIILSSLSDLPICYFVFDS